MDRKTAWVVPVLTAVIVLVIAFNSVGGIGGIAKEPGVSLAVFGILLVTLIPMSWLNYRRMRRQPIIVDVAEAEGGIDLSSRLDQAPVELVCIPAEVQLASDFCSYHRGDLRRG